MRLQLLASLAFGTYMLGQIGIVNAANPYRSLNPDLTPKDESKVLFGGHAYNMDFEKLLDRKLDIARIYHRNDRLLVEEWAQDEIKSKISKGYILLINWVFGKANFSDTEHPQMDWEDVAAGKYDKACIDPTIKFFKSQRKRLMVILHHEPSNNEFKHTDKNQADDYVRMFRHVHSRIKALRADNVIIVWCAMTWFQDQGEEIAHRRWERYYPGDEYIDWIAFDGYNRPEDMAKWKTWLKMTEMPYDWAVKHKKPIMYAEFGCIEHTSDPNAKAAWFNELQENIVKKRPALRAISYFNNMSTTDEWSVVTSETSHKAALECFNSAVFDVLGNANRKHQK